MRDRIELGAAPDKVWALVGDFGGSWHPLIADIKLFGDGNGQLRVIQTTDGKQIIERLDAIDKSARLFRYYEHLRPSSVGLYCKARGQAERCRKFCRMERAISP